VHSQIYLSEGATTEHFTDTIESNISDWWLRRLCESLLNFFHNVANLLWTGTQLDKFTVNFHGFFSTNDLAIESLLVDIRGHLSDFLLIVFSDKPSIVYVITQALLRSSYGSRLIYAILGSTWSIGLWLTYIGRALLWYSRLTGPTTGVWM